MLTWCFFVLFVLERIDRCAKEAETRAADIILCIKSVLFKANTVDDDSCWSSGS